MSEQFSKNLRSLCADYGSIAQVCRDIGLNRQQFNRYLSGKGLPSAHNLRKIARHFGLDESVLFSDTKDFDAFRAPSDGRDSNDPVERIIGSFRNQHGPLRRYLGFYHAYFRTPTWENKILCSLIHVYEKDGFVLTRSRERVQTKDGSIRQSVVYTGVASIRGSRLYIVENEMTRERSTVETILVASPREQVKYLRGVTIGVAMRPHTVPYASRSIWKRIADRVTPREALSACGVFEIDSRRIDPVVRQFICSEDAASTNIGQGPIVA